MNRNVRGHDRGGHGGGWHINSRLEQFARVVTEWSGRSSAFAMALAIIVIWAITGPVFGFSNTWQLVINTGTTIVTFLMVFLIQRAQNKDARALHLKLNEIVAAVQGASNRLINIEDLTEDEIQVLHLHYRQLAHLAAQDTELTRSHSIEEAESRHGAKSRHRPAGARAGAAPPARQAGPG